MTDLADKKCIPCEGGIPSFDMTEIHKYSVADQKSGSSRLPLSDY